MVKKSLITNLEDSTGHDFDFSQDMDDLFLSDDVFAGLEREQRSFSLKNVPVITFTLRPTFNRQAVRPFVFVMEIRIAYNSDLTG